MLPSCQLQAACHMAEACTTAEAFHVCMLLHLDLAGSTRLPWCSFMGPHWRSCSACCASGSQGLNETGEGRKCTVSPGSRGRSLRGLRAMPLPHLVHFRPTVSLSDAKCMPPALWRGTVSECGLEVSDTATRKDLKRSQRFSTTVRKASVRMYAYQEPVPTENGHSFRTLAARMGLPESTTRGPSPTWWRRQFLGACNAPGSPAKQLQPGSILALLALKLATGGVVPCLGPRASKFGKLICMAAHMPGHAMSWTQNHLRVCWINDMLTGQAKPVLMVPARLENHDC